MLKSNFIRLISIIINSNGEYEETGFSLDGVLLNDIKCNEQIYLVNCLYRDSTNEIYSNEVSTKTNIVETVDDNIITTPDAIYRCEVLSIEKYIHTFCNECKIISHVVTPLKYVNDFTIEWMSVPTTEQFEQMHVEFNIWKNEFFSMLLFNIPDTLHEKFSKYFNDVIVPLLNTSYDICDEVYIYKLNNNGRIYDIKSNKYFIIVDTASLELEQSDFCMTEKTKVSSDVKQKYKEYISTFISALTTMLDHHKEVETTFFKKNKIVTSKTDICENSIDKK